MKTTGNHPNSRLRRHVQRVGLRIILSVAFFDARYRLHLRRTCLHLSHKGLLPNSSGHVGVGTLHRTPQAISVFLSKPLDKDLEKLVSAVQKGDRFKALSFEDFRRYVFRASDHDSEPFLSKDGKSAKPKPAKPSESKGASVKSVSTSKPLWSLDSGLFLVRSSADQLRVAYDALERVHGNVTVNALLISFTNISDIMAVDQKRYNGGDRIMCRVRLGADMNPLCGKHPVVAVVPSRMIWTEEGKGHWLIDGQKIKSFAQIGSLPHFLPPGSAGVRECTVWLTAPWPTEHRAFDVRVFASDAGRVPLRQVGGQVSFSVHMPSPAAPKLEQFGLEPRANSCSALLHWVAPVEEKYCPPIVKHILHVEPMLPPTQQVVSSGDQAIKDLEVWNQDLRDLEKRKSIKVNDLQRGVPYRFAVQCVHQVESKEQEVLGAVSDFSETITMPIYPVPPQPGTPEVRAWQQTGKLEVLEILVPVQDSDLVDRFFCYDIEYRPKGKSEWTRIPDSQMHMNHDPKWDEPLDSYCFSCLLIGPKPVIEERDALEFRARSVNNAGPSRWSPPSPSIHLGSAEDQGGGDAEQTELQLTALDVFSAASAVLADVAAEPSPIQTGKATLSRGRTQILESPKPSLAHSNFPKCPRTHCRIQWQLEEGEEIHYQVEAREERLPFYAAWTPLPAYYRYNEDKVGEVFVSGLESFPVAEPLILRMLKGSGKRGVCATVRLHGVAGPPAPPSLQLARTLTAPGSELPVAELMWHEKEPLKEMKTLIEASWELENSLKTGWSQLATAQPMQMDDGEEGLLNICFVQLQLPNADGGQGTRCSLRMRYEGPDGQKGEASAETDAVQLDDAIQTAKAAQEIVRRTTIKKAKAPRRPQQLTIISGSKSLWEVSWEQKGKSDKVPIYEAEVCFGKAGLEAPDEDWQPVRSLYVQQMEEAEGENGGLRSVTAAVALPHDLPNDKAWRLRVRIQGGDWSTPTAWQEPGVVDYELPLPGQPTVRSNLFTFALQWEVSGHWSLIQNLQYEVQVSDKSDNVTIVKALVERGAASEAVKASFGYEELRFRVRAMSANGVSAPSEPSETEILLITNPAVQQPPPPPDLLGKGIILFEEKNNSLFQSALMHVCFPKPLTDIHELNEGLPSVEYKLEAQFGSQQDESDWKQIDRSLIYCDESTNTVTALVPTLDEDAEEAEEFNFEFAENESRVSFARRLHPQEVRFRLSAERVASDIFKFDPVHSKPSSTFSQDLPAMPWNLNIFGVSGDMLCINFQWSLLARSCKGLLWACLDVKRAERQNPEEEVPEAGDDSEDIDNVIGGIPVFWVPASDLRTLYGHYSSHPTADARDTTPSDLMSKACAKTNEASCVGMIALPKCCRDMTAVRVRLQMSMRNAFGQTNWSQPFVKQVQEDPEEEEAEEKPAAVCTLHLQYPEWTCILPGDDEMLENFSPQVVLRETSTTGAREVVLLDKAGPKAEARLVFTVQGVLPKCLHLDSSTGIITWSLLAEGEPDDEPMTGIMDTFVIQVALVESWFDEHNGFQAAASLCASAPMHLAAAPSAFGADDAAWDFLRSILRGFVMEVLQGRGSETMQAACELLQDEELVEGFADICETLASDVGLSAYEVLMRVLELPINYLELAAELDPDDFLDLICVALDSVNDEMPNSQGHGSEPDDDHHFGGVEGSENDSGSHENDGLGTSSSDDEEDQEEHQMPLNLDGEVRIDLNKETADAKIQVQHVDGITAPAGSPAATPAPSSSAPGERGSTMLVGLTKVIAAFGSRSSAAAAARRSSLARGPGTITARRASRAELQQLRRASHLKLDGSTENLEGLGGVSSNKLRSFRRMSSHRGSGALNHQGDEVTATRSNRPERKDAAEVEISYPDLLPMWPSFEECEFHPSINIHKTKAARRRSIMHSATHAGLSAQDDASPPRESIQFSIAPGLPGQICMDETTGVIRGCPLMERVAGCSYTISASDRSTGEVVGKCTILFAVAPAEVARLCNVAFRGQEVLKAGPLQVKAPAKGYPAEPKDPLSSGEAWVSQVTPRHGQPWARVQPPLHSATPGPSPVRPWMTVQQALNASLTKHSSRQGVIQLGPPLKDRDRNRQSTSRGTQLTQQLPPVNISRPRN
ncbi:unnamed protein product [Cladocopium goreaui]|uniref:Fibronectin type-III domain-containing protein n=1 Tax=Cladocopium goreaui TaxID=2562237 RepID=A0A9P1DFK3_9DINO|nr:unnamed protein product [Cladocopium goreaui]